MRRLFIIRKDLKLSPGKMSAMVGHCCEAYWTNILKRNYQHTIDVNLPTNAGRAVQFITMIDNDIWNEYVNGIFTKTICEAKNLNHLKKVENIIKGMNLIEGEDWGYINDFCLTELKAENEDKTTTVGVWFKPLSEDIAHKISSKYKLYGAFDKKDKKVYSLLSTFHSIDEESVTVLGRYSSLEEAKKHMMGYYDKYVKSNDILRNNSTINGTSISYSDGHNRKYDLYIVEHDIEIQDKFDNTKL